MLNSPKIGMEKLQKSMNIYMKAISKRAEIEDKEKTLPVAHLGGTMISHGEDFELDSEFGQCLTGQFLHPYAGRVFLINI
jgi:hypothetical protein